MPDEAKIVVVVQDGGGAPGAKSAGPPSAAPIGPPPQPAAGRRSRAQQEQTVFDGFLEIAQRIRGLIGGIFGPLAGAALDVASAVRSAQLAKGAGAAPFALPFPKALTVPSAKAVSVPAAAPLNLPQAVPIPAAVPIPPSILSRGLAPEDYPTMAAKGPPLLGRGQVAAPPTVSATTPPTAAPFKPPTAHRIPLGGEGFAHQAELPPLDAVPVHKPGGISFQQGMGVAIPVLAAVDAVGRALQGTVQAVGNFSASLISANPAPGAFLQGIGGFVQAVGAGIPVVGGFVGAIGAAIDGVGQMMNALDAMVDRYAGFSPALAQASAMADVAQVLGDFRRAQQVAPDLIKHLNERTAMQQQIEDQKIRFIHEMMPVQLKLMELAVKFLPYLEVIVNTMVALGKFLPGIGDNVDAIKKSMDEDAGVDFNTPIQTIAKNLFQLPQESR